MVAVNKDVLSTVLFFCIFPIRLYVSPSHPPSAEQKRVSPYKYLKDSLDVPELNKVRGSLLAKLESIAAQEGILVYNSTCTYKY